MQERPAVRVYTIDVAAGVLAAKELLYVFSCCFHKWGYPKWMVYNNHEKSYQNGWGRCTPISGNLHISKKLFVEGQAAATQGMFDSWNAMWYMHSPDACAACFFPHMRCFVAACVDYDDHDDGGVEDADAADADADDDDGGGDDDDDDNTCRHVAFLKPEDLFTKIAE